MDREVRRWTERWEDGQRGEEVDREVGRWTEG